MKYYEHTLIARQDISPSQIKQLQDKYTKIIEGNDGNIIKFESWGLMHLSYLIKKIGKGIIFILKQKEVEKLSKNWKRQRKLIKTYSDILLLK